MVLEKVEGGAVQQNELLDKKPYEPSSVVKTVLKQADRNDKVIGSIDVVPLLFAIDAQSLQWILDQGYKFEEYAAYAVLEKFDMATRYLDPIRVDYQPVGLKNRKPWPISGGDRNRGEALIRKLLPNKKAEKVIGFENRMAFPKGRHGELYSVFDLERQREATDLTTGKEKRQLSKI